MDKELMTIRKPDNGRWDIASYMRERYPAAWLRARHTDVGHFVDVDVTEYARQHLLHGWTIFSERLVRDVLWPIDRDAPEQLGMYRVLSAVAAACSTESSGIVNAPIAWESQVGLHSFVLTIEIDLSTGSRHVMVSDEYFELLRELD